MLTISMNVDGITRKMELLARRASDLNKPLQQLSKDKQTEVRQRFESGGPGWEPRKEATIKSAARKVAAATGKNQQKAIRTIEKSLQKQLKAAVKRHAKASGAGVDALKKASRRERTIGKRKHEIRILASLISPSVAAQGPKSKSDLAAEDRIFKRVLKAQAKKKKSGRPLGAIANSVKATVSNGALELVSALPMSKIHNEGGTAGNRAQIPARTYLEWTEEDFENAKKLFTEHLMSAFDR